jgi:chromosome segregation ATPase
MMEAANNAVAQIRTVEVITAEIKAINYQTEAMVLNASIEMGRRLSELKEHIGEPLNEYVKRELGFSRGKTYGLIKVFEEYGSRQSSLFGAEAESDALGRLTYSKALALLAIPSDEREYFAEQVNAEDLSVRELQHEIEQYKDKLAKAENELETVSEKYDASRGVAVRTKQELDATVDRLSKRDAEVNDERWARQEHEGKILRLEKELAELRSRPIETVVVEQTSQSGQPARSKQLDQFAAQLGIWQTITDKLLEFAAYEFETVEEQTKMKQALSKALAEVERILNSDD